MPGHWRPHPRIVVRLYDDDLAERVQRTIGDTVSRSTSYLAAPAFAAAVLDHQVLRTIAVGRHVLLLAEVAADGRAGRAAGCRGAPAWPAARAWPSGGPLRPEAAGRAWTGRRPRIRHRAAATGWWCSPPEPACRECSGARALRERHQAALPAFSSLRPKMGLPKSGCQRYAQSKIFSSGSGEPGVKTRKVSELAMLRTGKLALAPGCARQARMAGSLSHYPSRLPCPSSVLVAGQASPQEETVEHHR